MRTGSGSMDQYLLSMRLDLFSAVAKLFLVFDEMEIPTAYT